MYALVPICQTIRRGRDRDSPFMDWIPAVPPSWGVLPVRPVTLRRHLSMALPLSESRRSQLIRSLAISCAGYKPATKLSRRRQEVDRVHDRYSRHTFFRAEI